MYVLMAKCFVFFFKQKTAYEMRISDWSSDVCSSDLLICDVSMPTYLLTHWVNGRQRGERLGLEHAVSLQTSRTAAAYGFTDRGVIAAGKRADINLIDLDGMALHAPEMVFDLPAGGRRLVQIGRAHV